MNRHGEKERWTRVPILCLESHFKMSILRLPGAYEHRKAVRKLRLHVAIFVSRFTFKLAWNAHWCVYMGSLIVFIV